MLRVGVQTKNIVKNDPETGFAMIKKAGFDCCDFSLNDYLKNSDIYEESLNRFFDADIEELKEFFRPYKEAAKKHGITINQMHMPYPLFVPNAEDESVNDYLSEHVMVKSMQICDFLECPNIVIHGLKLYNILKSEQAEWDETEKLLDKIAPFAKEHGITMCVENLYNSRGYRLVEGPCCNAKKVVNRIDAFNKKHGGEILGFCFDIGHANIIGLENEKFIETLGNRLKVLHLHDNDGISDLHQIPFTFSQTRDNVCTTDWEGLINGLGKIGFEGVLSFETGPALSSIPEALKEDALIFINKAGKYLAKRIDERE